jgi:hypothetical protein
MWFSIAGGVVVIVVILTLIVITVRLSKRLGEKESECENLKIGNDWLRAAIRIQSSADPTLDDLDRMQDTAADTPG